MATRFINKLAVPFETGNITDLRLYMKSPVIDYEENFDVILWWSGKTDIYKKLSRMAADFLSLQPSSTASERTFSLGGMTISKNRTSLHTESARELMCLKSWNTCFN